MTKKLLLITIFLILSACDNTTPSSAATNQTEQTFKWKIVTTWPAHFPILQESVDRFAKSVEIMSKGQLKIKVYAGNELVPPLQVFDAVSQGIAEMGHGASYYWAGKVPAAQFFSTVPFGMTKKGMNTWIYYGGGLELWEELYQPFNIKPMPLGNTAMQMGGWFNKPIKSLEDIKGLRMRIPGLGGKVFKNAGGNPVLMAGAEIYTALERGIIDATEWIAPFHDLRLGLDRVAKYYYYPGWHEPGTELELIINQTSWEELPPHLQEIVSVSAMAIGEQLYLEMEYQNAIALKTLRQKEHVSILPFPDQVLSNLKQLTQQTLADEAEKSADFKRVHESYQQFREHYQDWSTLSDIKALK